MVTIDPRDVIREELKARNWTQEDLAQIIGRQTSYINRILSGNIGITARTADELGQAFGTSGLFWLRLETSYKLSKSVGKLLRTSPEGYKDYCEGKKPCHE